MAITRSAEDSWTKEMAKWERQPVMIQGTYVEPIPFGQGGRGGAPLGEYPKMLYRADSFDGGSRISGFNTVDDESQERIACGQGWCVRQEDALDGVAARQLELATLAANRAHNDRWMSDKAKAESDLVDEATMQHLPAIPETPIVRRRPYVRRKAKEQP